MASAPRPTPSDRTARRDELWLLELSSTPTAAGNEERVMAWIDNWLESRRTRLDIRRDDAGNYLIQRKDRSRTARPILLTAHLDHPAFIVLKAPSRKGPPRSRGVATLEFRGGVHDAYFAKARIEVVDYSGSRHAATITSLDATAKPFKRVTVRFDAPARTGAIANGDLARWLLGAPTISLRDMPPVAAGDAPRSVRVIDTHACDDLAALAAACAAFDRLLKLKSAANVGMLLTVAEEVGFIGAIHAARSGLIPKNARLLCLENSRSFPHDSPIGAGAILRVGDRLSVFSPALTNELSTLFTAHAKRHPQFKWQRKLMAGGACEATAFAAYGLESTCLCLPLGNYHNMSEIDDVARGKRPAIIAHEFVALSDYHGLIEMLQVAVTGLAKTAATTRTKRTASTPHRSLMESLYAKHSCVLGG